MVLGLVAVALLALAVPQTPELVFYPDDPLLHDPDDHHIEPPEEMDADPLLTGLGGGSKATSAAVDYALNINTLGDVPDSTWFTNRHGSYRMTTDELQRGPNRGEPPAAGDWRVVGQPSAGRTPKFTIEDAEGRSYLIKLDSPDDPELVSSAEIIGTKFFHAFGYNVPENHLVYFVPSRVVRPEAQGGDGYELAVLDQARRDEQGRVRAVASRMLEGEPIGPFSYIGTRADDPNDIFPHQHRRELRGLAVFASWLNHTDTKAANSLDVVVREGGRRFVRHYLIDFGSILGAGASGAKDPLTGYERYVDAAALFKSVASLGLWTRPYARLRYPPYPAIGHLEADYYRPEAWQPPMVNPAFERMDAADAFWAASIVARFSEEDIRAIVATARISDPEAEEALVRLLLVRKSKVVRYWLTRTNPLDAFRMAGDASAPELVFDNAAVRLDLTRAGSFRYRWYVLDNVSGERLPATDEQETEAPRMAVPTDAWGPVDPHGFRYAEVRIATIQPGYPHWSRPVIVSLRRGTEAGSNGGIQVVGTRHPRELPDEDEES